MTRPLAVRLPDDLRADIDARAEIAGESRHAMILRLLRAAVSDADGVRAEVRAEVVAEIREMLARL